MILLTDEGILFRKFQTQRETTPLLRFCEDFHHADLRA